MLDLRRLSGRRLFLDANAVIYFLEGMTSPEADEVFRMASNPDPSLRFVTNSAVVDEIFFKVLVLRAKSRGLRKDTVAKLRKNKQLVCEIVPELKKVEKFLHQLSLRVEPVGKEDVYGVIPVMNDYGLFGRDALIVKTMKKLNMKFLFSSDKDFDTVGWIEKIDPLGTPTQIGKEIKD